MILSQIFPPYFVTPNECLTSPPPKKSNTQYSTPDQMPFPTISNLAPKANFLIEVSYYDCEIGRPKSLFKCNL